MKMELAFMLRRSLLALTLGSALPLAAASHTWSGATNGNWSVAGNWSAGGAPNAAEENVILIFPAGAMNKTMNVDVNVLSIISIELQDSGYIFNGNALPMSGSITTNGGGDHIGSTINCAINLTTPLGLSTANNKVLYLVGTISGAFGIGSSSTGGPGGAVYVSGPNTYSGITTVSSGYYIANSALALGAGDGTLATGTVVVSGSTLRVTNFTIANEHLTIGGGGAFGNSAFQNSGVTTSWGGPVVLTADTVISAISGSYGRYDGPISGAFGINFRTDSMTTVTLAGANTYTGATTLEYGNVNVLGSTSQSVFRGPGSSSNAIRVLLAPGTGIFGFEVGAAPVTQDLGIAGVTAGSATLLNGLLLNSATARLFIRIQSAVLADNLTVVGAVNVTGATLILDPTAFDPSAGTSYEILSNDGADAIMGTFAGLPEGTIFSAGARNFRISYVGGSGNDITLTRVVGTPVELQEFSAE